MPFPYYKQLDSMDCGPTCLRMVAKHFGRHFKLQTLRQLCEINREGVTLLGISDAAEKIGFRSLGAKISLKDLIKTELPCILHWRQNHYVVLYKIHKGRYYISDPAKGLLELSENDFARNWISDTDKAYCALLSLPNNHE